jgi:hypothetical protein
MAVITDRIAIFGGVLMVFNLPSNGTLLLRGFSKRTDKQINKTPSKVC